MSAEFDAQAAHRHFAAACFNATWERIDNPERTAEQNEEMVRLAETSYWHWTQRDDCTPKNLSIGRWLLSRVYALTGDAERSRSEGEACLALTDAENAFGVGYAHEALARAADVRGDAELKEQHLQQAGRAAEQVEDADERKMLTADLESLG